MQRYRWEISSGRGFNKIKFLAERARAHSTRKIVTKTLRGTRNNNLRIAENHYRSEYKTCIQRQLYNSTTANDWISWAWILVTYTRDIGRQSKSNSRRIVIGISISVVETMMRYRDLYIYEYIYYILYVLVTDVRRRQKKKKKIKTRYTKYSTCRP